MSAKTVSCWICGKEYEYCPHCRRHQTWMQHSCCSTHYQIEMILQGYREGILDEERATWQLSNIGITEEYDFSQLLPAVARDIKEIIAKEKPITKSRSSRKTTK